MRKSEETLFFFSLFFYTDSLDIDNAGQLVMSKKMIHTYMVCSSLFVYIATLHRDTRCIILKRKYNTLCHIPFIHGDWNMMMKHPMRFSALEQRFTNLFLNLLKNTFKSMYICTYHMAHSPIGRIVPNGISIPFISAVSVPGGPHEQVGGSE